LPYAGHSFRGVALRMDHELTGSACRDAPHRAAEEVRQLPNCASLCRCDDHIHGEPWACMRREQTVAITDGRTTEFRGRGIRDTGRIGASDRPAIERMALIANMCDYIEWSKRKVEGQRRETRRLHGGGLAAVHGTGTAPDQQGWLWLDQ